MPAKVPTRAIAAWIGGLGNNARVGGDACNSELDEHRFRFRPEPAGVPRFANERAGERLPQVPKERRESAFVKRQARRQLN
jgi:hypothetical protein